MGLFEIAGVVVFVLVWGGLYLWWRRIEYGRSELGEVCRRLATDHDGLEWVGSDEEPAVQGTYSGRTIRIAYRQERNPAEPGSTWYATMQSPIHADLPDGFEMRTRGLVDRLPLPSSDRRTALREGSSETVVVEADAPSRLAELTDAPKHVSAVLDAFSEVPDLVIRTTPDPSEERLQVLERLDLPPEERERIRLFAVENDGTATSKQSLFRFDGSEVEAQLEAVARAAETVEQAFGSPPTASAPTDGANRW